MKEEIQKLKAIKEIFNVTTVSYSESMEKFIEMFIRGTHELISIETIYDKKITDVPVQMTLYFKNPEDDSLTKYVLFNACGVLYFVEIKNFCKKQGYQKVIK